MRLKILNGSIQFVVEYLPKLQLKGRANRARQKLLKRTSEKFQEFYSDVQEIKSEHLDDIDKRKEQLKELSGEEIIIDMTEYANLMPALYDALLDYDYPIDPSNIKIMDDGTEVKKPSDASIHDYLIDVLEEALNEDEPQDTEDAQFTEVTPVEQAE